MRFRINRKLNDYNQDKLIIQIKRFFSWRDLFLYQYINSIGWVYMQVEFEIEEFLKAKKLKEDLESGLDNIGNLYIKLSILGFTRYISIV